MDFGGCLFLLPAPCQVYQGLEPGLHARLAGLLINRDRQYRDIELLRYPYEDRLGDDLRQAGLVVRMEDLLRPNVPEYQAGLPAVAAGKAVIAGQWTDLKAKRSDWW